MPVFFWLICIVCARNGPGAEFKVVWCYRNHVNSYASDATIIIAFDSQTLVIQVHKYSTEWETLLQVMQQS